MSSDINFDVASWFLGNFLVKPYFNTQCPPCTHPLTSRHQCGGAHWNREIRFVQNTVYSVKLFLVLMFSRAILYGRCSNVSFSSCQRNLIKNIQDWSYDCTDHKNGIDFFFIRLVKWPKIEFKKCQNLIFKVNFQCQNYMNFFDLFFISKYHFTKICFVLRFCDNFKFLNIFLFS